MQRMTTAIPKLTHPDEARFAELMEQSYRKVYNMAYRLAGNRPDAEDLTQEAFFRAYRSFNAFEGDKPFENWIFRIVTRLFLDLIRARNRRVKTVSYDAPLSRDSGDEAIYFDVPDAMSVADRSMMSELLSDDLMECLAQLSPEQRQLVKMANIDQMPYSEIAEILGKPVGTIRSRLHRAHKQLRTHYEKIQRAKQAKAKLRPLLSA